MMSRCLAPPVLPPPPPPAPLPDSAAALLLAVLLLLFVKALSPLLALRRSLSHCCCSCSSCGCCRTMSEGDGEALVGLPPQDVRSARIRQPSSEYMSTHSSVRTDMQWKKVSSM